MSDGIVLQEGQVLTEHWEVQFKGRSRIRRKPEEWIECRVVRMYHSTVYGGANGQGRTVEEARLNAVLGLARAITDDLSAFQHNAEELFYRQQLHWFQERINELEEELESGDGRGSKSTQRRIKLLEQLMAEWQEDHDYWPSEAQEEASSAAASKRAALFTAQAAANAS